MPREVVLDFKLYTNALKVRESDSGDLYVSGTTSSTIRDRQGDEITLDAIKSMADTAKQNMTVFLNHNYNVPEDLFGSVTDARIVKRLDADTGLEVYDLDIDVKVCPEDENPAAMQAYKAIKRGVKLGMSIGARVEKVSKRKDSSGLDTYVIEKVNLLESSIVGIPANQRSYLQNALKSLRAADQAGELEANRYEDVEAKAVSFKVGDMVTWGSSGGNAKGKITKIVRDGKVNVPGSSFEINGTPEDPACLIRVYRDDEPTDTIVGHKMSTLQKSKSGYDLVDSVKAVEVEGIAPADRAPLIGALYQLLAETTAFYLKAHGAHWNVTGEDFSQYHELFGEIYEDVHGSLDPLAENLRKLNSPAPFDIKDLAGMATNQAKADDSDPESLAEAIYAANEALLENIMVAFKAATDSNQQGIANFLAERQDMHQKWSWQLRASLAPEEAEGSPETPEMPGEESPLEAETEKSAVSDSVVHEADGSYKASGADVVGGELNAKPSIEEIAPAPVKAASAGDEVENVSETLEKATRVTVTVSGTDGKERELPIPASATPEPVVEEKGAMPVAERLKNVVSELDSVKSEEANDDRAKYIEYAAGWVQAYLEYEAAPAAESVEAGIVDETTKSLDHHVEATETPAEEADLAVVAEEAVASVPAEEVVVENTAATELLEEKEQLEKDLEHAVKLLELALKSPAGRKSILTDVPAKKGIDAPWLSPYIQAILEKK